MASRFPARGSGAAGADACADAGIDPSQVGFVEAHGTGTAVGDPIEATALARGAMRRPPRRCTASDRIGENESWPPGNGCGHCRPHQGSLVLKHRQIPASLHFKTPSPHIDFAALNLRVPRAGAFPEDGGPRIVGVNSFGFGGANAHVILGGAAAHRGLAGCRWRRTRTGLADGFFRPVRECAARLGVAPGSVDGSKIETATEARRFCRR